MFKQHLEKAEEPEIKLPTSVRSMKKQESSRKTLTSAQKNTYFCFIDYAKTFDCVLKRWEYQATWPASWEIWMQVRKQQLELDMDQQTGSK